jgi:hypothetical protein
LAKRTSFSQFGQTNFVFAVWPNELRFRSLAKRTSLSTRPFALWRNEATEAGTYPFLGREGRYDAG